MSSTPDPRDDGPAPAAATRILDLYQRHAQGWSDDRVAGGFPEEAWLRRFFSCLPMQGDVLDLGCGCGRPVAAWLIDQGRDVTGVDGAAAMIAQCRAAFPRQTWLHADMRGLDLGRRFAGVLAWDSFFHLPHADQRAMFAVFSRHAVPGAPLMFSSGTHHGEAMGRLRGETLYHASLAPAEYRQLLGEHGFAVLDHRVEDPDCGGRTIWLARSVSPPEGVSDR